MHLLHARTTEAFLKRPGLARSAMRPLQYHLASVRHFSAISRPTTLPAPSPFTLTTPPSPDLDAHTAEPPQK